jgi:hypothetical protein
MVLEFQIIIIPAWLRYIFVILAYILPAHTLVSEVTERHAAEFVHI